MRRKKKYLILGILFFIFVFGIGYAYLNTTLNISGTTDVDSNTWDIYWDNVQVTSGSVSATTPTIDTNLTTVSFSVHLSKPGDFYEFTVDAKNDGSIDAMIEEITNKLNGTEISTTNSIPTYLSYTVTYADGVAIEDNHLFHANSVETYKVRVAYRTDISPNDLPATAQSLSLSFGVNYIQSTNSAVERTRRRFYYISTTDDFFIGKAGDSFSDYVYVLTYNNEDFSIFHELEDCELERDFYNNPAYACEKRYFAYDTSQEVVSETGHNIFLRLDVLGDIIQNISLGFVFNGNDYYLNGGINHLEEEKNLLLSVFGEANCSLPYEDYIFCSMGDLHITDSIVYGEVMVEALIIDSWQCDVTSNRSSCLQPW